MSGAANMQFDLSSLHKLRNGYASPILRFFRWNTPTVSYGKHQSLEAIRSRVPAGWDTVQRPTGGGIVLHDQDLCFSLCWTIGQPPLPARLKDHYAWIHGIVLKALVSEPDTRLATCNDCTAKPTSFALRDCFTEPVGYDVLASGHKIVGGALCRQQNTFLYQGSIQSSNDPELESRLRDIFMNVLTPGMA